MKDISIIIVNWNTRDYLFNVLTSIFEHPPHRDFEVIVVDNASTDGSREMVVANFPNVKLIANSANIGFARAVNPGIRESSGRYILLLNTDLVVYEGAIDEQIKFLEENPHCAFCGGTLINNKGMPSDTYGQFPSIKNLLGEAFPRRFKGLSGIAVAGSIEQTQPMPVDFVSGADMMFPRSVCESVGYLDERFFMYFEEADWEFRAKQHSWEVYYVPSAHYLHVGQGTIGTENIWRYWLPSLGLFLRNNYHGLKFVSCWLLWQLLRARNDQSRSREHSQLGISQKMAS